MKKIKQLLKSKTFWLNVVGCLFIVINDQALNRFIPTEYLVSVQAILNIANRYLTNKPMNEK